MNNATRPTYSPTAKARRKCPKCEATKFRAKVEAVDGIDFAVLICDNQECSAVLGAGPV